MMTGPIAVVAVEKAGPAERCNVVGHAQLTVNQDAKI